MKVKEAIKKAMKAKKVTQIQMAESIGASQSSIAMFLTRDASMKVDSLLRMANACGYDLALVDREDPRKTIVIGERDEVDFRPGDVGFDARVREIIADEIAKRSGAEAPSRKVKEKDPVEEDI